jgi:hypothetical protein
MTHSPGLTEAETVALQGAHPLTVDSYLRARQCLESAPDATLEVFLDPPRRERAQDAEGRADRSALMRECLSQLKDDFFGRPEIPRWALYFGLGHR